MSSWFTGAKTWMAEKAINAFAKHEGLESQPKFDDNGKGFFGLNALNIDGNKIDFQEDLFHSIGKYNNEGLKDPHSAYLIVNVATE